MVSLTPEVVILTSEKRLKYGEAKFEKKNIAPVCCSPLEATALDEFIIAVLSSNEAMSLQRHDLRRDGKQTQNLLQAYFLIKGNCLTDMLLRHCLCWQQYNLIPLFSVIEPQTQPDKCR
jgi:hypothetical protein